MKLRKVLYYLLAHPKCMNGCLSVPAKCGDAASSFRDDVPADIWSESDGDNIGSLDIATTVNFVCPDGLVIFYE